ncbi:MAG: MiaB/RimO family radical SAM methylthiotransferase, partial [Clostridia bacterium]|nr:MiaB/RimO family radical SAM methylthiotransferase [Clostridia bacterium]
MENKRYTISVTTLGCRVNQYESLSFTEGLKKYGIHVVRPGEPCDAAIVNTCTVTAESDRKSRQMIRRAASYADHVIVTGCFAQISADTAAAIDKVTYVCGNGGKASLADTVYAILTGTYGGDKNNVGAPDGYDAVEMVTSQPERTRSYIKIEDGCENRCAYCIIPKARGPVRSKKPETVLEEAKALAAAGCREVILTGIETASYGMDFEGRQPYGYRLAELIGEIAAVDGIERIGLGSLEPTVMSDYFVGTLASTPKILPHFHLSIQSGCSRTLAEMKRRYNADMARTALRRMRDAMPDVTFSCDVIVGFPGETEEDFSETLEFCREARFLHMHIFPYSKRAGTVAAERKEVSDAEIAAVISSGGLSKGDARQLKEEKVEEEGFFGGFMKKTRRAGASGLGFASKLAGAIGGDDKLIGTAASAGKVTSGLIYSEVGPVQEYQLGCVVASRILPLYPVLPPDDPKSVYVRTLGATLAAASNDPTPYHGYMF